MIAPRRARYGARDNRHDLLAWEGPDELPVELAGLTDKPTGHLGPGDRWWPSVGCGPLGRWWALWWTVPDRAASRGGMVRSEVALWPLHAIGRVDDLRPVLEALAEGPVAPPAEGIVTAVAAAWLEAPAAPVLPDLDAWPGLLAALWLRLWPNLRPRFAARVALGPPQGGGATPMLFATPAERAPQWPQARLVRPGAVGQDPPRAVRWLVGGEDPTLDALLEAGPGLGDDIRHLRRLSRAADRVDALRAVPSADTALGALRTLVLIAPSSTDLQAFKTEAVGCVTTDLPGRGGEVVMHLRNLDPAPLPDDGRLPRAVEDWVATHGPGLAAGDAAALLAALDDVQTRGWWRDAVDRALRTALRVPDQRWSLAVLRWLAHPSNAEGLWDRLAADAEVERRLLAAFDEAGPEVEAEALRAQAVARGWSRLHARCAMRALPSRQALTAHRRVDWPADEGLDLLVDGLPGPDVVAAAVGDPTPRFVQRVARRTAREPALLDPLDPGHAGWRGLWSGHLDTGGARWPPGAPTDRVAGRLLDAVLDGQDASALVARLAPDLGRVAHAHPRRSALWSALRGEARRALLAATTDALIEACGALPPPTPEAPLAEAVVERCRRQRLDPPVVAAVLSWEVAISEEEAIEWLRKGFTSTWRAVAHTVCRAVADRRWQKAANALASAWGWDKPLRPALARCAPLMSWWNRGPIVGWKRIPPERKAEVTASLIEQVAGVGADLAPDGLDALWEQVGGERKRLPSTGTPGERWQAAARLAHNGAIPQGLGALLAALQRIAPYNPKLEDLARRVAEME